MILHKERELSTGTESKGTSIFGKGTFGRKLFLTMVLIGAGIAVGVMAGKELVPLSQV